MIVFIYEMTTMFYDVQFVLQEWFRTCRPRGIIEWFCPSFCLFATVFHRGHHVEMTLQESARLAAQEVREATPKKHPMRSYSKLPLDTPLACHYKLENHRPSRCSWGIPLVVCRNHHTLI